MKILVLGASGMAGHTIAIYFKEKGHDVFSFSTSPVSFCESIIGDATNTTNIKEVISKYDFDIIINCIGILNKVAEDNPAKAIYLNSYLPFYISEIVKNTKTKFIHMSTDCVFAGNTGPYNEASLTDGRTFYDRTKALGELNNLKDLTFRNSIIGPDTKIEGIGLFNWFMKQKGVIKGFSKAIWTGVTTLTLAKAMDKAIEDNLSGLYNLVNNTSISKYDLLILFNREFRDNQIQILEDNAFILDKTLINTRTDFDFLVPSYEKMVLEMKEWVELHPDLYKHYN
jgi:dTDP-4-dehydrorhamnose reductase